MKYDIECFNNVIYSSHAKTQEKKRFSLHLHNHFEMNLFLSGNINFYIDGEIFTPNQGDLFLINNTQLHGPKILGDSIYERAIVHFPPKMAKKLSNETTDLLIPFHDSDYKHRNIIHLNDNQIRQFVEITIALENLENCCKPFFGKDILLRAYLAQILVLVNHALLEEYKEVKLSNNNTMSDITLELIDYIQNNLFSVITLEDIEKQFNMNRHYLNRIFKDDLGTSIYQFAQLNKISLAKRLLEDGLSVSEVCDQLNYNNYSTFARAFKNITGLSPTHYINSVL